MAFLFWLIIIVYAFIIIFHVTTKKYLNPYKLYLIFAPKGEGKSTLLQKLAHHYTKKGYTCFCNIGDCQNPNVYEIDINYLPILSQAQEDKELRKQFETSNSYNGISYIPKHSVIFCDEINLLWDNRDFKSFPKDMQKYFRLQRHYKHIFIGFSQTYDCDKKIRDLADYLIIIRRFFRVYIGGRAWRKKPVIISPDQNNGRETATMTDDFIKQSWLFWYLWSPFRAWLPYWCKKHDSFKSSTKTEAKRYTDIEYKSPYSDKRHAVPTDEVKRNYKLKHKRK